MIQRIKKIIFFLQNLLVQFLDLLIEEIEPRLFSFNSPNGACDSCDGLGYNEKFDPDLVIGNARFIIKRWCNFTH